MVYLANPPSPTTSEYEESTSQQPIIPFTEGETEIAMALVEESHLRELANIRMKALFDPKKYDAVTHALSIMEDVDIERRKDTGIIPIYSVEYWKDWKSKIAVERASLPSKQAPTIKKKPSKQSQSPLKKTPKLSSTRTGSSSTPQVNFSPIRYNESHRNNPRVAPPKGRDSEACVQVRQMMKSFGGGLVLEEEEDDEEKAEAEEEVKKDLDSDTPIAPILLLSDENNVIESPHSKSHGTSQSYQTPPPNPKTKPNQSPSIRSPSITFPASTRTDWNSVTQPSKPPSSKPKASPSTHYDILRSEDLIKRRTIRVRVNPNPAMITGLVPQDFRDATPGPDYNPKLNSLSNKRVTPLIKFADNPRFKVKDDDSDDVDSGPNPTTYVINPIVNNTSVLPFNRTAKFSSSSSNSTKNKTPPKTTELRNFTSFGYGCNLEEHVLYGQCLNGNCSKRSNKEIFNAKKIVHHNRMHKLTPLPTSNKCKKDERTALHFAVIYKDLALVNRLCNEGVIDIDATDANLQSCLHIACENGYTLIVERLLNNATYITGHVGKRINPLINAQDENGNTPLHLSSIKAHRKIVEMLIDASANPDIQNSDGLTALAVSNTSELFGVLEYYSEISKERGHTDNLDFKRNEIERAARQVKREEDRMEYNKANALKNWKVVEIGKLSFRASDIVKMDRVIAD